MASANYATIMISKTNHSHREKWMVSQELVWIHETPTVSYWQNYSDTLVSQRMKGGEKGNHKLPAQSSESLIHEGIIFDALTNTQ